MKKRKKTLYQFVICSFVAGGTLFGANSAKAADLTPVVPGGAVTNNFSFRGTWFIKAFDPENTPGDITDDVVYVDFEPTDDSAAVPPFPNTPQVTSNPEFTGETGTFGRYDYGFNDGSGALEEFEATGAAEQGLIKDVVFPAQVLPGGRNFVIDDFLALDSQDPLLLSTLSVDNGLNFFDADRINPVIVTETGSAADNDLATTLQFVVEGTYTGPDTGPLPGTVAFTSIFDGFTEDDVLDAIFNPTAEAVRISYSASGEVEDVPEPSSLIGLGLLGLGIFAKKKLAKR